MRCGGVVLSLFNKKTANTIWLRIKLFAEQKWGSLQAQTHAVDSDHFLSLLALLIAKQVQKHKSTDKKEQNGYRLTSA